MIYKFIVGQNVQFLPGMLRNVATGPYKICRLMPETDTDSTNPSYRIKNINESHERVVTESHLALYDEPECLFT